jgi:hypothetical protein
MEWELIAPMIMSVVLILTVGGVLVLRPITKRFSELLEFYVRDRSEGSAAELRQMRELLETMEARFQLMEDRLDFTERLLQSGQEDPRSQQNPQRTPDAGGEQRT